MRDLVDVTFRLMVDWSTMDYNQMQQVEAIYRYFRDRETEYETGEPVLPGWAALGNVAAQYDPNEADPFSAAVPDAWPPDE